MGVGYNNSIQKKSKRKGYGVIIIEILLLLQCIIISVDADPKGGRWGHTSVLINNRLYVYGGRTDPKTADDDTSNINELMSLDVSKTLNPSDPQWEIKTPKGIAQLPLLSFHSCISQNDLLILFGGEPNEQEVTANSLLFAYSTTTESWLAEFNNVGGVLPKRLKGHTMATSGTNHFLWGGLAVDDDDLAENALYIFTTSGITYNWQLLTPENPPLGRWDHSATILNGKMYIIGGYNNGALASMTDIPIYNTITGFWILSVVTAQQLPSQRRGHRAVGTADNRIIIYGGTGELGKVPGASATKLDDVAELKVNDDNTLIWTIPEVKGTKPPGRFYHSMTLVNETKAIVTYGLSDDFSGRNLFILDTGSYTWEDPPIGPTSVSPPNTGPSNTNPSNTDPSNTNTATSKTSPINNASPKHLGLIIGIPIGTFVILIAGLFCFWFKKRRRPTSFVATPYEKQLPSALPITGPSPYHLSSLSPSQGDADGSNDIPPFIPPFAASSYNRRQSPQSSLDEKRNLTPVDQHDSLGSFPINSSQSQLPQINPNVPYSERSFYQSSTSRPTSPHLASQTPPYHSNTSTPPPSIPTPLGSEKDLSTKTSSPNLNSDSNTYPISSPNLNSDSNTYPISSSNLNSDSNTHPASPFDMDFDSIALDLGLPPVAPLSINRTRTPSQEQVQAQQQYSPPQPPQAQQQYPPPQPPQAQRQYPPPQPPPISTSSLPPTGVAEEETTTEDADRPYHSPLFRTGTIASPTDKTFSLRSALSMSRNSASSPPPGNRIITGSSTTSPDNDNKPSRRFFKGNQQSPDSDSE